MAEGLTPKPSRARKDNVGGVEARGEPSGMKGRGEMVRLGEDLGVTSVEGGRLESDCENNQRIIKTIIKW